MPWFFPESGPVCGICLEPRGISCNKLTTGDRICITGLLRDQKEFEHTGCRVFTAWLLGHCIWFLQRPKHDTITL